MYRRSNQIAKGKAKATRESSLWWSMVQRCTPGNPMQNKSPTYSGCTVSDNFKDFQYFANWCNNQIGFLDKDEAGRFFEIDKDLLSTTKIYSEDTCCFVPKEINSFFAKNKKNRGEYLVGVGWHTPSKRFRARCGGVELGKFETEMEAYLTYKQCKEALAKQLALKYNARLDPRVIDVLNNFTINIYD